MISETARAVEAYRPMLEEMFDVDLSGVQLKQESEFYGDLWEHLQEESFEGWPEKSKEKDIFAEIKKLADEFDRDVLVENMGLRIVGYSLVYFHLTDTIYVPANLRRRQAELHLELVHELAHAVHCRVEPATRFRSSPINLLVGEGFAEYVSLDMFNKKYVVPGVDEAIMEWKKPPLVQRVVGEFSYGLLQRLWPGSSARLDPSYRIGYRLFQLAVSHGADVVDVLRNPPDPSGKQNLTDYINNLRKYT